MHVHNLVKKGTQYVWTIMSFRFLNLITMINTKSQDLDQMYMYTHIYLPWKLRSVKIHFIIKSSPLALLINSLWEKEMGQGETNGKQMDHYCSKQSNLTQDSEAFHASLRFLSTRRHQKWVYMSHPRVLLDVSWTYVDKVSAPKLCWNRATVACMVWCCQKIPNIAWT